MKKIFLLIVFVFTQLCGQVENSGQPSFNFAPNFFLDIANYKGDKENKTRLDIFLQVPYSNIQFVKKSNGYFAKYTVTVSLLDIDKNNVVLEKLWTEKIETETFNPTISRSNYNLSYKSMDVTPNKYKLVCTIEDSESKKNAVFQDEIKVQDYKDSVDISDIMFISQIIKSGNKDQIIPNISHLVTSKDTSLSFFYEVYSDTTRKVKLEHSINSKDGQEILKHEEFAELKKGTNVFNKSVNNILVTLGDYQLVVKIYNDQNKLITGIGKKFYSKIFGFPTTVRDLDLAIDQMIYIAPNDKINEIKDSKNYSDRLAKFEEYWKEKDPSPNTIENEILSEYYRRVEYANAHFKSYFDGWRTDMGMIYITLGPPDQVIRRPYELDSKPYEIWEYYEISRQFVFVDQTNFGDYRLLDPVYGDWYRYRQ